MSVKILILYYSSTGANYQLAQWAQASAEEAGTEVKLTRAPETAPKKAIEENPAWKAHIEKTRDVPEVQLDDLEWADAIIFSIPTRYGNVPSQIKAVIDSTGSLWMKGKLKDKLVTAMSSAMNPHGGQEQTLLSLYTCMYHWGAIVVTPGYTDKSVFKAGGNPYGTTVTVDEKGNMKEDVHDAVSHQTTRLVEMAQRLVAKEAVSS